MAAAGIGAFGNSASARLLFGGNYSLACGEKERNYSVLGHPQYVHGLFTLLWLELGGAFAGGVRDAETPPGARLLLAMVTILVVRCRRRHKASS